MSRARNLKPGFFKNEELAELPFEYRILFQGLWCLADREGRMEDRPKRIKAEVFPYDDVDVSEGLDALESAGFVMRYSANETQYIQVLAFARHQNPHCKESASTIPAPCKHSASPEISGTSRADSLNRIPLTGLPESGASTSPATGKRKAKAETTLTEWTDALDGADAIPADDPLFAWAAKVGIPHDWLALAWWVFEARYADNPKRYADWRAVFRKAVREDWLKLWRTDQRAGGFVLTAAGEMAQREMAP